MFALNLDMNSPFSLSSLSGIRGYFRDKLLGINKTAPIALMINLDRLRYNPGNKNTDEG